MTGRFGEKYLVEKVLGQGAFGVVYVARDEFLDRLVAIKTIRAGLGGQGNEFEKRFLREARIAARLNHLNIATVLEAGQQGETIYLVMELVDGRTLRQVLDAQGRMTPAEGITMVSQLLDALDHAHEHGVVHRDIKPENVMVRNDGVLKVTDFGIAKLLASQVGTLTQDGAVVGTPCYMAPEQVLSKPATPRADIYSTCAVLYEMVGGVRPFSAETLPALLYKVLTSPPAPLPDFVPSGMRDAILRGMAKDPDARFATTRDLLAALREGVASGTSTAAPPVPAPFHPEQSTVSDELSSAVRCLWIPPDPGRPADRQGGMEEEPLVELLLRLRREGIDGLVVVEGAEWAAGIEVGDGLPYAVHGGPPQLATGAILRERGMVSDEEWPNLAAEMWRTDAGSHRIGEAAVRLGFVRPADYITLVEKQREERMKALLDLDRGVFRVYQGFHAEPDWRSSTPLPVGSFVAAAIRSRPALATQLAARFRRRVEGRALRVRPQAGDVVTRFQFGARTQRMLYLLDGRSFEDALSSGSDPESEISAYLLWVAGAIDIVSRLAPNPTPRSTPIPQVTRPVTPGTLAPNPTPRAVPIPQVIRPATAPPPAPQSSPSRVIPIPQVVRPTGATPRPDRFSSVVDRTSITPPSGTRPAIPDRPSTRVERIDSLPAREPSRSSGPSVVELTRRADELLRSQHYAEARKILLEARNQAPRNPEVLSRLGWASFRAQPGSVEAREEARRLLEEALDGDPRMVDACVRLAHVLRLGGDLRGARTCLQRALQLEPDNSEAQLDLKRIEQLDRMSGR